MQCGKATRTGKAGQPGADYRPGNTFAASEYSGGLPWFQ
jgi:hypothetical protein